MYFNLSTSAKDIIASHPRWIDPIKSKWLIIAIFTLITNLSLLLTIVCRRNLRTLSNAVLCSMFICGSGYALLFLIPGRVMENWHQSSTSLLYIAATSGYIFTISYNLHLCVICACKILSLISPLRHRVLLCRKNTIITISVTWAISIILGPTPVLTDILYHYQNKPIRDYIIVQQMWHTVIFVLTIIIPIIFTLMLYIVAFIKINRRHRVTMLTVTRTSHKITQTYCVGRNLKLIKQMLVVLGLFTLCWLPYLIFVIIVKYMHTHTFIPFPLVQLVSRFSYLTLSYPAINPILFAYYTISIRNEIKILITQYFKL